MSRSFPAPVWKPRRDPARHGTNYSTRSQLYQLKQKLLHAALEDSIDVALFKLLCGAANQAAEQAWCEACPLLVFPCLFEELADLVRERYRQQQAWPLDEPPGLPAFAEVAGADDAFRSQWSMQPATQE